MAISLIRKLFGPTIQLDEIAIDDTEFGSNESGTEDKRHQLSKSYGFHSPVVVINRMIFAEDMILNFVINTDDFLPTCTVTVKEHGGIFASKHYPKDGDLMNVLIRSVNDDYKSVIRNDYKITSCTAPPSKDAQGEFVSYTLTGVLNVPGMFSEDAYGIDKTSFGALQETARNLNLGFASNDNITNDRMKWLCALDTNKQFIEHVALHCYKNDESFYQVFIDQYYHLNMIEMNSMFTISAELQDVTTTFLNDEDYLQDSDKMLKEGIQYFLTNSAVYRGTPFYVSGYSVFNNTGDIHLRNSYRRYLQIYNKDTREFLEYFIETLNSEQAEDQIILKGRSDEDHTLFSKWKYLGQISTTNTHENYLHARLQNFFNNVEVEKMGLYVDLPTVNPGIIKGSQLPVFIVNKGNELRTELTKNAEDNNLDVRGTQDAFLSGWYVVRSSEYIYQYSTGTFKQRLKLVRREWTPPVR